MLPDSDDDPARISQPRIRVAIPGDVALDLLSPKGSIAFGPGAVLRTPVPVAAIHEYGHSRPREHDVHTSPHLGKDLAIDAKAES
jgi:hypothetical protein